MDIEQILQQIGRQGWRAVGEPVAETAARTNPITGTTEIVPTGRYFQTISDGKGNNQRVTLAPSGIEGPTGRVRGWTVLEAPETPPKAPATADEDHQIITIAGRRVDYYPNRPVGQRYVDLGPAEATPAAPTPLSDYVPLRDPNNPQGPIIAMVNPKDPSDRIPVPQGATPDRAQLVPLPRGGFASWNGTTLTTVREGEAPEARPMEGKTRNAVEGGFNVVQTYSGGEWVTTSVGSRAVPEPEKPAKEGDKRGPVVVDGYYVMQEFRGGNWVTTSVGERAVPREPEAPTTLSAPAEQEFIVRTDPSKPGGTTQLRNPNFAPADRGRRLAELKRQAEQKRDQLRAEVDAGAKSEEQARAEFDAWYDVTIEPQAAALQAEQATVDASNARTAAADQRAELTAESTYETNRQNVARQAAADAVDRVTRTLPMRVGPNFGTNFARALETLSTGGPSPFSASDFTYDMPDLNAIAEQATSRALAGISPYAAARANAPMPAIPPGLDIAGALASSRYQPAAPPPTGETVKVHPDGTVEVPFQPRRAESAAESIARNVF